METVFSNLLVTSLQASLAAVLILLVKKIFSRRINVRISYLLWSLVLIRLVIPALPASPASIYNVIDLQAPAGILSLQERPSSVGPSGGISVQTSAGSTVYGNQEQDKSPQVPTAGSSPSPFNILTCIWAAGVLVTLGYFLFVNIAFAVRLRALPAAMLPDELVRSLKAATRLKRKVRFLESTRVSSPCVFGILRPAILLPEGLASRLGTQRLTHVLSHEFAHIKRCDLLFVWLSTLLCSLHWFNPVLWYSAVQVRRDQELCADAYVLSHMEGDTAAEYGQTLLSLVKERRRQALVTAGISEDKHTLRERIRNITVFARKKYRITLLGILLILLAGVVVCTSQVDYPKTAEERMAFDKNVRMSFSPSASGSRNNMDLEIFNANEAGIHRCELLIYSGRPSVNGSELLYENRSFSVGAGKSRRFNMGAIDYNSAYIEFNYKIGYSLNDASSTTHTAGDMKIYDKTNVIHNWGAVSKEEIDSFIKENNVVPLATSEIYGFYTILLYQNGGASGYYELYKDTVRNKVKSRCITAYSEGGTSVPVSLMGGTASGSYPFVNFMLNDPRLVSLAGKMELVADYGTITTYAYGAKAYTVETKGYGSIQKILIYDHDNRLIYDGEKILLENEQFKADDPSYTKVTEEKGISIVRQTPIITEVQFIAGMFPSEYIKYHESSDIDLKIPLLTYENTSLYLKGIFEYDEEYLVADLYFIHHVGAKPGNLLSGSYMNINETGPNSYSPNISPKRDVYSKEFITLTDMVSLRGSGPGDQFAIYIKKNLVEKTRGNFTVYLENANKISYIPKSLYRPLDENHKAHIRDLVYRSMKDNLEELTGEEEVYETIADHNTKVANPGNEELVNVSGRYVYYGSFKTTADGLLGPRTALVDPETEEILGWYLRY